MRIINFRHPNLRYFEGEGGDAGGGALTTNEGGAEQQGNPQGEAPSVNPNWNEVLNLVPGQLHEAIIPHLKKWDTNFQTKLSEVQSQLEPWQQFEGQDPERISQALQFWQLAEADPRRVYDSLAEFYKFGDQGQQGQEGTPDQQGQEELFDLNDDSILQHPKVKELIQGQEVLAQHFLQQQQQEEQRELEAQINQEEATIKEANPDFSEADVIQMYRVAAASNISLTEAAAEIKQYKESIASSITRTSPAPDVMGSNGRVPAANAVDPTKLNGNETRSLVADIIRQSKGQG